MAAPVPVKVAPRATWVPERKVLAGGIAGLIAWAISVLARRYGVELDATAQGLLVSGVTVAIQYATPPSQQDVLRRLNDGLVQVAMDDPTIPVTKK